MGLLWCIKWKLSERWRKLDYKFYHIWWSYPRCSICKHPLADHMTYTEAPSRFGVCVNACCIEDEVEHKCDTWNVRLQDNREVNK